MTPGAPRNRSILFMPLEFPSWLLGKPHSYTVQFGLEDGMLANGARTFVVPAFPPPPVSRESWQERTAALAGDRAWLGLVHARFDPGFCEWLVEHVPVRVGMLFESMDYTDGECAELPALAGREQHVLKQIRSLGLTHVLCGDERDAAVIEAAGAARAVWFPSAVPERFVARDYRPPLIYRTAFFGTLYSDERRALAARPGIHDLLALPRGPELGTDLPAGFDEVHGWMVESLRSGHGTAQEIHAGYVEKLRSLRLGIFRSWMEGLPRWNGLVNLPSYFKGYAGRVIEGMAANVPVVSWEIPGRPRNSALFEDGREILLFGRDDPDRLVEHLERLRADLGHGRRILEAARGKVLRLHTSEVRVRQIFDWIDEGDAPDYGC